MNSTWMRLYRAERIKGRHTAANRLWLLMPALTLALAYGISQSNGTNSAYNWWYTLMMQGMITLFCCLSGGRDKKRKNRTVLSLPVKMEAVWDAKLLTGMGTVAVANLLFTAGILLGGCWLIPRIWIPQVMELTVGQAAGAAAVMIAASLWQVPFCFWMNQKWGLLPTLLINIVMTMAGVVLAVTKLWLVLPWAILPRLMVSVVGILPNGLPAMPESMTYSQALTDPANLLPGLLVSLLWFGLLWAASRRWYGRKGAQTV